MEYRYTLLLTFLLLLTLHRHHFPTTAELVKQQPLILEYHNGHLLKGNLTVNLIWYGHFTPSQRSTISDFILSLSPSSPSSSPSPSAASWWRTTANYKGGPATVRLGSPQLILDDYPLGKSLTNRHILALQHHQPHPAAAAAAQEENSINVVLTAADVAVEGFCMRCSTHGSAGGKARTGTTTTTARTAYVWVGNSATQCPGQCAWPFHQPAYGPQAPVGFGPPNGDVGVDGMVVSLATGLAGAVTNPYADGYYQGPAEAPLEAVTACAGVFGSGAYPGFAGKVLVDGVSRGGYNAVGVGGRRFLLPAMWDPRTRSCKTLV